MSRKARLIDFSSLFGYPDGDKTRSGSLLLRGSRFVIGIIEKVYLRDIL
mgnify:CR=1 FL=1